jgi:acetylornithine/succinyldiaminopimelate/putrescine aminotransferase
MMTTRQLFQLHLGLPSVESDPIEIIGSKGIYLIDSEGNELIDLVSGVSVSNVGHLHPKVVKAITQQLESYMHVMVYGKFIQSPQVMLAAKLAENLPNSLDSVYFVNSGSEAIEGALKLAKRVTGRTEMIGFKNAYHGGTSGALSLLGNETLKNAFRPLLPDTRMLHFNDFDELMQITERTACVLIEPIQAEAGIILPKEGYLEALRRRCDDTGTLLIFDEIQMGMGRTGKLFAFEHYHIVPDILCLAKALGGGMPIGAFISSKEKMSTFTFNPALGHITTFGGHPVCCAAALAALDVLFDEKLIESADQKGKIYVNALMHHKAVKTIRQTGLMLGVEISDSLNINNLMKVFKINHLIVDQFLFNENAFRIAPPLTITWDEIDLTIKIILQSLEDALAKNEA